MPKIPEFSDDLNIIAKLGINPNVDDGLSGEQLQQEFDKSGLIIQRFINEKILPLLNEYVASSDGLLPVEGGTMKGDINMDGKYTVSRLKAPSLAQDAATKAYVDNEKKLALELLRSEFKKELDEAIKNGNEKEHPVGSIYISSESNSPAALYGGSWEKLDGVFLFASDDGRYHPAGERGGEWQHKLVGNELPKVSANIVYHGGDSAASSIANMWGNMITDQKTHNRYIPDAGASTAFSSVYDYTLGFGADQPHNNMPPYLSVNIWKRVA